MTRLRRVPVIGAREVGGRTAGILPGLDRSAANPYIGLPRVTGLGPLRTFLAVADGDVAVAVAESVRLCEQSQER